MIWMFGFGIFMGIVFPYYASLFDSWTNPLFKLGSFMAGLMIGLFCFAMVQVILLREIKKIDIFAKALKSNDLTASIAIDSNDSIGAIVRNLSESTTSIRGLISHILKTSEILLNSLNQLRNFADNMNSASGEISSRSHAMTATAGQIRQNSSSISNAVSESADSVSKIVSNVGFLAQSLDQINTKCLAETTLAQQVNEDFKITKESILELSSNSKEISSIAGIISSIADQTNLLAINAAVEAANAGVHGKSFAIVAQEVKSLANQSIKSAEKISALIDRISPIIESSRDAITGSSEKMENLTLLTLEISQETTNDLSLLKNIDSELLIANQNMQQITHQIAENNSGIVESTDRLNLVNSAIETISNDIQHGTESILQLQAEAIKLAQLTKLFTV